MHVYTSFNFKFCSLQIPQIAVQFTCLYSVMEHEAAKFFICYNFLLLLLISKQILRKKVRKAKVKILTMVTSKMRMRKPKMKTKRKVEQNQRILHQQKKLQKIRIRKKERKKAIKRKTRIKKR